MMDSLFLSIIAFFLRLLISPHLPLFMTKKHDKA